MTSNLNRMSNANISTDGSVLVAQMHAICNKPVCQRCDIVIRMLEDLGPKELHSTLPLLIESLFGFDSSFPGWYLARIVRSQHYEFRAMRHLLSPDGPLLRAIYRLTMDSNYRYEFPLSCLPHATRCLIDEGTIPEFYHDKLQLDPAGKPYSLLLDAFTYYMFHFSYFLVNTQNSKMIYWYNPSDCLYPILVEDYLNAFFPLGCHQLKPMTQPMIAPSSSPISSSTYHQVQAEQFRLAAGNTASPVHRTGYNSPMFNSTPVASLRGGGPGGPRQNLSNLSSVAGHGSYTPPQQQQSFTAAHSPAVTSANLGCTNKDTWRTEVFLVTVVEFWLCQVDNKVTDCAQHSMNQTFVALSRSGDHMRIVRSLIKHLHYFVNTLKTRVLSPYRPQIPSPWDELKRLMWPHYVQKRLYIFLCYNFEWWPLDTTFRQVLETWLSFIQPWRYTDPHQAHEPDVAMETEYKTDEDEEKWRKFVFDHILFYTVLWHKFLPRALRIDLCSSKNAFMLFRLSKTFNSEDLRLMLQDVESLIQYPPMDRIIHTPPGANRSPPHDFGAHGGGGSRHSDSNRSNCMTTMRSVHNAAQLAQQFNDLEGPHFYYTSLFSLRTERQVVELLKEMMEAKRSAARQKRETASKKVSWYEYFFGNGIDKNAAKYFSNDVNDDCDNYVDFGKAENYLEMAAVNLAEFFHVERPSLDSEPEMFNSAGDRLLPDVADTPDGPVLTKRGRYQIITGSRKFQMAYTGDPDLQPIRSFESAFLVRSLQSISQFLNMKYSHQIRTAYNRHDYVGRLAQQLFRPSILVENIDQLNTLPPALRQRVLSHNRPRVCLRHLATYQAIGYFLVFFFLLYFWQGVGPVGYVFLVLFFICIYYLLAALVSRSRAPLLSDENDEN